MSSTIEDLIKYRISRAKDTLFSQLFTWRQKGDYDDLFDFQKDLILPYFEPKLIPEIERLIAR